MVTRRFLNVMAIVAAMAIVPSTMALAQRGGGGGGGGAPAGGEGPVVIELGRLDRLAADFQMTKEQKDKSKAIIDAAHKTAGPIRDQLTATHAALGAAVLAAKPQAEIDAAALAYAEQSTLMASLEMKTLADVLRGLTPEQRGRQLALPSAFYMFRGIFLDAKRWNFIADGFYGY